MKFKYLFIILLSIFSFRYSYSQEYLPQMESRYFTSDSISVLKPKPFWAAGEVIGTNLAVWAFDRYVVKESWATPSKAISSADRYGTAINSPLICLLIRIMADYISTRHVVMA